MSRSKAVPPEDEFDRIFRESYAAPLGIFVVWVAVVRSWRWLVRRNTHA